MSSSKRKETDDEIHGPAKKSARVVRGGEPAPSYLSMKRVRSRNLPLHIRRKSIRRKRVRVARGGAPAPSCLSMKRDRSMDLRHHFRGKSTGRKRVRVARGGAPAPSCLSMKRDRSMDESLHFRGKSTRRKRVRVARARPPKSSHLYRKSDRSIGPLIDLTCEIPLHQSVDHGVPNRTKPGHRKYGCQLTLDPNTAHRWLSLSEGNRRVTQTLERKKPYPDHPVRCERWPALSFYSISDSDKLTLYAGFIVWTSCVLLLTGVETQALTLVISYAHILIHTHCHTYAHTDMHTHTHTYAGNILE